jgi:hAT family C-terminal dimerisation region/Domain of unknown function (DUF4413)
MLLKATGQILSGFEKATRRLSAAKYPTLNNAVPIYNLLIDELESFLGQCNEKEKGRQKAAIVDQCGPANKRVLTTAMKAAHTKLRGYYSDTWASMYAIAVILDPRWKMRYYRANEWEPELIAHAKNSLVQAMEAYGTAAEMPLIPQSSQASQADRPEDLFEEMKVEWNKKAKQPRVEKESELERYLATPIIDFDDDILVWWKQWAHEYPCLARIARDYLAIPATSAPAERAFSGGADLVTRKRGSLSEDTIQAYMCLDSWYSFLPHALSA